MVNKHAQGEKATQVESVIWLIKIRTSTLNVSEDLKDVVLSTQTTTATIPVDALTDTVKTTRALLAEALDKRFFCRYTSPAEHLNNSFVFECQVFLHPQFKNLELNVCKAIYTANEALGRDETSRTRIAKKIVSLIHNRIRKLMMAVKDESDENASDASADVLLGSSAQQSGQFSSELSDMYSIPIDDEEPTDIREGRVEEELQRWIDQRPQKVDSVLGYWSKQTDNYKFLSKVARALYAFPVSSAQIERDFGDSGKMVRNDRSRLSGANVEMAAFLRANQQFTDLTQCDKIPVSQLSNHIPHHMLGLDIDSDSDDDGNTLPTIFSSVSVEEEDESKDDA
ncbi:hypothetical protein PINS_up012335 [Pythium insidiosum]|nr:hypothetical protein PINS_up012335 [Pythium insidiosum]